MTELAIKRKKAVDGCGCLRCREVDPALMRRSTAGDLRWSLRLLRRRPWLLAFVAGLGVLWWGSKSIIAPAVPTVWQGIQLTTLAHNALSVLLLGVFLRGFFGAVVAAEIADRTVGTRHMLVYTTRRLVPLALTVAGLFALLGVTLGVSILCVSVLVFDVGLLSPTIFDGVTPTLLFGAVLAPVFYKFWIAPDICVVGDEGVITALRSSWRITTAHWRRVCLLLVSFTATITAPYVVGGAVATVSGVHVSSVPGISLLALEFQWVTTVVWYAVGAQIYIRAALS